MTSGTTGGPTAQPDRWWLPSNDEASPSIDGRTVVYQGPALTLPAPVAVTATVPAGAAVSYTASAVDDSDGAVPGPSRSTGPAARKPAAQLICAFTAKAGCSGGYPVP